jgi:hypothetical protein
MAENETDSIFDIEPDEALEALRDAEAMAAYRSGQVVPHAKVVVWLTKLANGDRVPPPDA